MKHGPLIAQGQRGVPGDDREVLRGHGGLSTQQDAGAARRLPSQPPQTQPLEGDAFLPLTAASTPRCNALSPHLAGPSSLGGYTIPGHARGPGTRDTRADILLQDVSTKPTDHSHRRFLVDPRPKLLVRGMGVTGLAGVSTQEKEAGDSCLFQKHVKLVPDESCEGTCSAQAHSVLW